MKRKPVGLRLIERSANNFKTGCTEWLGAVDHEGYGRIRVGSLTDGTRKMDTVARAGYKAFIGAIPVDREVVCYKGNRRCWNPDHILAVPHGMSMGNSWQSIRKVAA